MALAEAGDGRSATPANHCEHERKPTMTLFELALLLTTAGVSGVGFASLGNTLLDRIGREPQPQPIAVMTTQPSRR